MIAEISNSVYSNLVKINDLLGRTKSLFGFFCNIPQKTLKELLDQLNGHELEQTPGDSGEQGSLEGCSPWGHEQSDMTEQLNNDNN